MSRNLKTSTNLVYTIYEEACVTAYGSAHNKHITSSTCGFIENIKVSFLLMQKYCLYYHNYYLVPNKNVPNNNVLANIVLANKPVSTGIARLQKPCIAAKKIYFCLGTSAPTRLN